MREPAHNEKVARNEEVMALYRQGVKQSVIARTYGVSRQFIHIIVKREEKKQCTMKPERL